MGGGFRTGCEGSGEQLTGLASIVGVDGFVVHAGHPVALSAGGVVGVEVTLAARPGGFGWGEGGVGDHHGAAGFTEDNSCKPVLGEGPGFEVAPRNEREKVVGAGGGHDCTAGVGKPGAVLFLAGEDIAGVAGGIEDQAGDPGGRMGDLGGTKEPAGAVDHREGSDSAWLDIAGVFELAEEDRQVARVLWIRCMGQEHRGESGSHDRVEVIAQEAGARVIHNRDRELAGCDDPGESSGKRLAQLGAGRAGVVQGQGDGVGLGLQRLFQGSAGGDGDDGAEPHGRSCPPI